MKTDEKELLDSVIGQEPGAFEALLARYRSLIYSVFYGKNFDLPDDSVDDLFNSFVLALQHRDYHRLRAFQGRNNCSLATYLQIVATRFTLDELRKWKRHPKGRGRAQDVDEREFEVEDERGLGPEGETLDNEQQDVFHNMLFDLEWKRISAVLWVLAGVDRETVADVMSTSRANIDALYKRAKDQMTARFGQGDYSRRRREPDPALLIPAVKAPLRELLAVPPRRIQKALLQPGAERRALAGLVLTNYPRFRVSVSELGRLAASDDPTTYAANLLEELLEAVGP